MRWVSDALLSCLLLTACTDATSAGGIGSTPDASATRWTGVGTPVASAPTDASAQTTLDARARSIGRLPVGVGTAADASSNAVLDAQAAPEAGDPSDASTESPRTVTIHYTTVDQMGTFTPLNVGAVWIEDSQGVFVKTLERYAFIMQTRLVKWYAASMGNSVDAVASATARSYGAHTAQWNLTDVNGQVVPDGVYTVYIEVTDRNATPGYWTSFTITKAPGPHTFTFPDTQYFTGITVDYP